MGHKVAWTLANNTWRLYKMEFRHLDECMCSIVQEEVIKPYLYLLYDAKDLWDKQGDGLDMTLEEFIVKLGLADQL